MTAVWIALGAVIGVAVTLAGVVVAEWKERH